MTDRTNECYDTVADVSRQACATKNAGCGIQSDDNDCGGDAEVLEVHMIMWSSGLMVWCEWASSAVLGVRLQSKSLAEVTATGSHDT